MIKLKMKKKFVLEGNARQIDEVVQKRKLKVGREIKGMRLLYTKWR